MPKHEINIEKELKKPASLQKDAFISAIINYVFAIQIEKLNQEHMAEAERSEKIKIFLEKLEKEERDETHGTQETVKVKIPHELLQENTNLMKELAAIKQQIDSLQEQHKVLEQQRSQIFADASATQQTHRVVMVGAIGNALQQFLAPPPPDLNKKQHDQHTKTSDFIKKYHVVDVFEELKSTPDQLSQQQIMEMVFESFKKGGIILPKEVFLDFPTAGGHGVLNKFFIVIRENNPHMLVREQSEFSHRILPLISELFEEQQKVVDDIREKLKVNLNKMSSIQEELEKLRTRFDTDKNRLEKVSLNTETLRSYAATHAKPQEKEVHQPDPASIPFQKK